MIIQSAVYGELEIGAQETITLVQGMPGFESFNRYAVVKVDEEGPFRIMQCMEEPGVSFVLTNPFHFFPDYDIQLPESVQEELAIGGPEEVEVWTIVSIQDQVKNATVNLMAPIILNRNKQTGKQVILNDSGYHVRQRLLPEQSANSGTEG